jgi:hypothetical protein
MIARFIILIYGNICKLLYFYSLKMPFILMYNIIVALCKCYSKLKKIYNISIDLQRFEITKIAILIYENMNSLII